MRRTLAVALLLVACASPEPAKPDPAPAATTGREGYPAVWWKELPASECQSWEIPPQAAGPGEVILSKRNELGILSNFAPTPFELDGKRYASLEGLWQSMKYPEGPDDPRAAPGAVWKHTRAEVEQMVAFDAHAAGVAAEETMKALGIDWISYRGERFRYKATPEGIERHYAIIVSAARAKLAQNPEVRRVLLATGDLKLRADHHEDADGTKTWRYYDIWMKLRDELRKP